MEYAASERKRVTIRAVLAVLCIISLSGCVGANAETPTKRKAEQGKLDLRGWDFEKSGSVEIEGHWLYWAKEFVDPRVDQVLPSSSLSYVPFTRNLEDDETLEIPQQYGTYGIRVYSDRNDSNESLGLRLSGYQANSKIIVITEN